MTGRADGGAAGTRTRILDGAHACILASGIGALSTRMIADAADVPLSQIHYHFGGKRGLVLAVLERENQRLLARQADMFDQELPLWKRWEQACDFLEDDLASGYVHILHEMIAAGWSDPEVAAAVRDQLLGWQRLLAAVAREATSTFGGLGPFTPEEIASLAGGAFLGAEATILLGVPEADWPNRSALRKVGELIRAIEENEADTGGRT